MAKCVSAGIKELPDYAVLLKRIKNGEQKQEDPEEIKKRIIDALNK